MQRTKSSAQTNSSKPVSITTQFRFQKVEQLTHLLNQAVDTPDSKNNVGEKVLEMLKTQIKTNYDQLYENYGENKKKILKHIQAVETNIAGQNAMNNRFDDLVKEKSKYDKLHAQVGDKQRKLKKLNDVISKLTEEATGNKMDLASENINKLNKLEEQKEELEHQAYIVKDMLAVRQRIQMALREKQLRLNEELGHKKEKEARLGKENEKRHQILKKLAHELQQSEEVEIPIKLAEELALKMEMYENKHSYNSIIGHEAILQEKKFSRLKQGVRQERQQQRITKQKKDNEERNQLQQLYSVALIKNLQEEKIKQFCCVSTIQETFDHQKLLSVENLQKLASEIQAKILQYQEQNRSIEKDIETLISNQSQSTIKEGLYQAELALSKEQKEKEFLCNSLRKWQALTQNWKIILELLQIQLTPQGMSSFLATLEAQRQKRSLSESQTNTEHLTQTKINHFQ